VNYTKGMQNSSWGGLQHLVADYVAAVYAKKYEADKGVKLPSNGGVKENGAFAAWLGESDLGSRLPFFAVVEGMPAVDRTQKPPAPLPNKFDQSVDTRRFVRTTVSYRTMKALSGHLDTLGAEGTKAKQDIAMKAVCWFESNRLQDYRLDDMPSHWSVAPGSNWIGYFPEGNPPYDPFADLQGAQSELLGFDAKQCGAIDEAALMDPFAPLP
jgi:hypothetical protein